MYAKGAVIEDTTNIKAVTNAILEATKHCNQALYNKVIIESDSLLLKQVLTWQWDCPWRIIDMIGQIRELIGTKHVHSQYILRERNKLVDYQVNLAINKGNCSFNHFRDMKTTGMKIINIDKSTCPCIRVPPRKG